MIADKKPPNGQPDEGKGAFDDNHLLPTIESKQPPSERGGSRNGQRLAKIPIGICAGTLGAGKPIREQNRGGGKDSAFSHAKQEPHDFKLCKCSNESATDSTNTPGDEKDADDFLWTPASGSVTARDLQQH